ncbi:MAG: T9SS type A sorting domain-containing protein [Ignavibacteria bacterium]|nr:T9SS type A sorting domain-containing protein [Ignavibacteria bacterium]
MISQGGWVIQTTPVTDDIYAIQFVNLYTGYAAGENGRIVKSTNGGITWFSIGSGLTSQFLSVIRFFDANTGYVSGNWSGSVTNNFFKTTNGGLNWTLIGSLSPDRMQFIDLNLGWGIVNQSLGKTTSGGVQWSFSTFDPVCPNCSMNDIYFHNENTGYTSGDYWNSAQNMGYMFLFKTTNAGGNWNQKFVYQSNVNPYAPQLGHMFFPDNQMQIGYALGSFEIYAGLYKTTNGGENWSLKKQFPIQANYQWFTSADTGWVTSTQGRVMFTSDGGSNFFTYTNGINSELNRIFFLNDSVGWIACNDGIILARNAGINGIHPVSFNYPSEFILFQNYPNPFNPVTNFGFRIADFGMVKLTIYDALGKEIASVVNEELQPGSYNVDWDASNYPSGVYFYKLQSGDFVESKKMVLIK